MLNIQLTKTGVNYGDHAQDVVLSYDLPPSTTLKDLQRLLHSPDYNHVLTPEYGWYN